MSETPKERVLVALQYEYLNWAPKESGIVAVFRQKKDDKGIELQKDVLGFAVYRETSSFSQGTRTVECKSGPVVLNDHYEMVPMDRIAKKYRLEKRGQPYGTRPVDDDRPF